MNEKEAAYGIWDWLWQKLVSVAAWLDGCVFDKVKTVVPRLFHEKLMVLAD